jgi:SAM-dependent methyltransferase
MSSDQELELKMKPQTQLRYGQVIDGLRQSYDRKAEDRDAREIADWKIAERAYFLSLLQKEGKQKLLEIGAGTGWHSQFFQKNGLDVVCTDLSPENVKLCQAKGLTAYTMDFLKLDFPERSFDAAFALNCLLHVPSQDLPQVLSAIRDVLKPQGLFYLGLYGGKAYEGVWPKDAYEPKRFFCFHTDAQIQKVTSEFFELLRFKRIALENEEDDFHFQSLILRRG